jgi:acetyl esterase/lipase
MHASDAIEVVEDRCSHSGNRLGTMPSTVEIGMKRLIFVVCLICISGDLSAQKLDWQPSPGHTQVPIWPDTPPDAQPAKEKEFALSSGTKFLIAGKPAIEVDNVTQPTMTIYSPKAKNTGTAVIVFPGGGFYVLAIDLEGTEACDWLTSRGITCVLLKYRVPDSGPHDDAGHQKYPKAPMALEDAQRTMRLIRFHAAEHHIDPHKIGVLGFSAGGYLVADISTNYDKLVYPVVDEADKVSCRPDFAVALYPGHLQASHDALGLNPKIPVTRETPPTFLVQAEDDHVDNVNDALVYYIALKRAGVPVEMHLYAQGGHAFGLRRTKMPITAWPELMETWLRTIGMISDR